MRDTADGFDNLRV